MTITTMLVSEIFLLTGGIIGFLLAIVLFDAGCFNERPIKIKKTVTMAKGKLKPKVPEETDLSAKIPSKDETWVDTNCEFDGMDSKTEIVKNRAKEDKAYSILQRSSLKSIRCHT